MKSYLRICAAVVALCLCPCSGDDGINAPQHETLARMVRVAHTTDLPAIDRVEVLVLPIADHEEERTDSESNMFVVRPATASSVEDVSIIGSREVRSAIHSSMFLEGKNASTIAEDWRSLEFEPNGAFCHIPAYGLRFYRGDKLIFSVSICWKCHNFYLPSIDPDTGQATTILYGFHDNSAAKKLLNDLRRILPHPDIQHPRLK